MSLIFAFGEGATCHTPDTAMFLHSNARGVGDLQLGRSQAEQARAVRRPVAQAELWVGPQVLLRVLGSRCRCCPRLQA